MVYLEHSIPETKKSEGKKAEQCTVSYWYRLQKPVRVWVLETGYGHQLQEPVPGNDFRFLVKTPGIGSYEQVKCGS